MKKPDYLPVHDDFYAWVANNPDNLRDIFSDIPDIVTECGELKKNNYRKLDSSYQHEKYTLADLIYFSQNETLIFETEKTSIDKRDSEKVSEIEILNVEFESESSNSDKYDRTWWDLKLIASTPEFELKNYWKPENHIIRFKPCEICDAKMSNQEISKSFELEDRENYEESMNTWLEGVKEFIEDNHNSKHLEFKEDSIKKEAEKLLEVKGEWFSKNSIGNSNVIFNIEYKTSIEESSIDELIRQVKKRDKPSSSNIDKKYRLVVTFDPRFERYRNLLENEGLKLFVYGESKRKELERKFSSSKKVSLGDF